MRPSIAGVCTGSLLIVGALAPALPAVAAKVTPGALACFAPGQSPAAVVTSCSAALGGDLPSEARIAALLARADANAVQGLSAQARADFDTVLALAPGDANAAFGRGRLNEKEGKVGAAETDYDRVVTALRANPQALPSQIIGDLYARRGALRLARNAVAAGIDDLKQAVALAPDDGRAQRALGLALLKAGKPDAALPALTAAIAVTPSDVASLMARATVYGQLHNIGAAVADFTTVLSGAPAHAGALEGRGVANLQRGDYTAALADFEKLLALNPTDGRALFLRGSAHLQLGHLAEADGDFSGALARRADDDEVLFGRAMARQFSGNYAGAADDLSVILTRFPAAAEARAKRGALRVMLGAFKDAVTDFSAAQKLPNAPFDLALWRFIAESRGGQAGAKENLAAAVAAAGATAWPAPVADYFLGRLTGDALLAAAHGDQGRLCEAYFYLGEAALISGEAAEAATLFTAAKATGMSRFTEYAAATAALAQPATAP